MITPGAPLCTDTDGDNVCDSFEDANTDTDDNPATTPGPDSDGDTIYDYLDTDDDGDGTPTLSEAPDPNDDGNPRDARDSDRDGEPDYLDRPLGTVYQSVTSELAIANGQGGLTATLADSDFFGSEATAVGDLDGDGVVDMAVAAAGEPSIYVLLLNSDGSVKAEQKIATGVGGFTAATTASFGSALAGVGDLDGDGLFELVVGDATDNTGGSLRGAVYVLFLNADGTVRAEQKIADATGGLTALENIGYFGSSAAGLGDLDGDGINDIIVGAQNHHYGTANFRGAVYVLLMNADGTVKGDQIIGVSSGGFTGTLDTSDNFGGSVAGLGDLDGDGVFDAVVGAVGDDDGGAERGAAYVLLLNTDGTVKAQQKISDTSGGLSTSLTNEDYFGGALAGVGDLDGDGVEDLMVGAGGTDVSVTDDGAFYFLALNTDGTVKSEQQFGTGVGGFTGPLAASAGFGSSIAPLGDLDGEGLPSFAIGASGQDSSKGAVHVLEFDGLADTDQDGLIDAAEDANTDADDDPATSPGPDTDGDTTPNYLDTDDDGDGTLTSAENADPNSDGNPKDAVDSDRDGEPDYLDKPLGTVLQTVASEQKIAEGVGGLAATLTTSEYWADDVTSIGDLDGDGIVDMAVGGNSTDAIYVLFLNADGTVKSEQEIATGVGGFTASTSGSFGSGIGSVGDLDGDGLTELAVGDRTDNTGSAGAGAVHILFMNADGTVRTEQKIANSTGGLTSTLDAGGDFGQSVSRLGDLDNDGIPDIIVGARSHHDGGTTRGATYVLLLNADGTVKSEQKIFEGSGGFSGTLGPFVNFGDGVSGIGDLDGDGVLDAAVGSSGDDDGGLARGAVYVLFLNTDGTVKAQQKISDTVGGLTASLSDIDDFGVSLAGMGDVDGDGIEDLLVGATRSDVSGTDDGAVYLLSLNTDGTVKAETKFGQGLAGFAGPIPDYASFGSGVTPLGDIDGDGTLSFAVGASSDDSNKGAVHIIELAAPVDSDGDGLWDHTEDANTDADDDPATTPGPDTDGDTVPNYLDNDDDGDGTLTSAENADPNADGSPQDAKDLDRDGQPDYLDRPLAATVLPRVVTEQKISNSTGGLVATLGSGFFTENVTSIGDLDGDGIVDMAFGSISGSVFYVLFLNADGTVKAEQEIGTGIGGFTASTSSEFGAGIAPVGDLDGDGVTELAVGDTALGGGAGAIFILFMNADGTVRAEQEIANGTGGLTSTLSGGSDFGDAIASLGDLDGDGLQDIIVGAPHGGFGGRGAAYVLFLNADGTVKADQEIFHGAGGFSGTLDAADEFGDDVTGIGDLDGDGVPDAAVGASDDDDGGPDRGAVYILFLNTDGTVKADQKISDTDGGFTTSLGNYIAFGFGIAGVGDLDGDGAMDLMVGSNGDDSTGVNDGSFYLLSLNTDGTVKAETKFGEGLAGFVGPLSGAGLGNAITPLGDLDGDGGPSFAVGAYGDSPGAIYVLELAGVADSDGDGLWDATEDANTDADDDPSTTPGPDTDGDTTPNYLDTDDDGDGTLTSAENADPNGDGYPQDAKDSDLDGQPDYLDEPYLVTGATVAAEQKISSTTGGLTGPLDDSDFFGYDVASIGDLDGDGVVDLAVGAQLDDDGATDAGAVHILFLNADGTVKAEQKISDTSGGLTTTLDGADKFGSSVSLIGDLDGDGLSDIVVGAPNDDDQGTDRGAVYVLFLNADGTVKAEQKISDTTGGLLTLLGDSDRFGAGVTSLGDLDGDGVPDLAVGANQDDDGAGGFDRGAVYVLFLYPNGTVKAEVKISDTSGGLITTLTNSDYFGADLAGPGDIDGDGLPDLVVGAPSADDGEFSAGEVYVLFLYANGTVKGEQKISQGNAGFTGPLDAHDRFGSGVAGIGDIDKDGTPDIAVGADGDDDGASGSGAVYVLTLNPDGTVKSESKISNTSGGLATTLGSSDKFGFGLTGVGDLDGDGTIGIAVGANNHDDGGTSRGAVYVLDLRARTDSDGDGLWDATEDANTDADYDPSTTPGPDTDGDTIPNYLDNDDDGDGTLTSAENADPNSDGYPRDAKDTDLDGQPDYLDKPLSNALLTLIGAQKISATLPDQHYFGRHSVTPIGDLDSDGINDVVVGTDGNETIYVLFLNADGTVKAEQEISNGTGGLTATIDINDDFGAGLTVVGDLDGDGRNELAVGEPRNDDGGTDRGAVHILFLNADGTVKAEQKISDTTGGLATTLGDSDQFGYAVTSIGDLDADGIGDLLVGAPSDGDGGNANGAVYVLFLNSNGTVKAEQKISDTIGGLVTALDDMDFFGSAVTRIGDLDGDGVTDVVVGAIGDDDGGSTNGAVYVLFLNTDGTVKAEQKISDTDGGLSAVFTGSDAFGTSTSGVGDVDGDGSLDLLIGSPFTDLPAISEGVVHLLSLNSDGTVQKEQQLGNGSGGFPATLDIQDYFGTSVASVGDLDGDGSASFIIGAIGDDDGGDGHGAVYIVELFAVADSDGDGLWDHEEDANTDADDDPATTPGPDTDGDTVPNYLDNDDDGDGTLTSAENPDPNSDGDPRDARDSDRDGQPDYLDRPLADSIALIASQQRIAEGAGGLTATLTANDFGDSVATLGDLDRDGVVDMAFGSFDGDIVYVLFLNADGTVKAEQAISTGVGGFTGTTAGQFGRGLAAIGDLDGDGLTELAAGDPIDDTGGTDRGAVHILFLNADGTVRAEQKIADATGGLTSTLDDAGNFGNDVAALGDMDGDGVGDVIVGARRHQGGGTSRGAAYVLMLNSDGTVKNEQKIFEGSGGFSGVLEPSDLFGHAVTGIGDLDGDGVPDAAVAAVGDDDGGAGRGGLYVLLLNADGTVKGQQKISDTAGGLTADLNNSDFLGTAVAGVGDVDGDGIEDIMVGAAYTEVGGTDNGAFYLMSLNTDGTVKSATKLGGGLAGLIGPIPDDASLGDAITPLGDLDGDGTPSFGIGAPGEDANKGAIYILELSELADSDGDGLWDHIEDANTDNDDNPATNPGPDTDGDTTPNHLDADDDGDTIPTAIENADPNSDGDPRDAKDSDRDGQPDYLDKPSVASSALVSAEQKISSTTGGLTGPLADGDGLGIDTTSIGDLDGDGIVDVAVGTGGAEAAYVLFLNADGTVKAEQKIANGTGGLTATITSGDLFGITVASVGDLDGDGLQELAVGAMDDDDGGTDRGAVYVLFLNADGTVRAEQKISDVVGGFTTSLDDLDRFGRAVTGLGDVNGDGIGDILVGAKNDGDGGSLVGAVYVLFLDTDGTVKAEQKISATQGGLTGPLDASDAFGESVAGLGDLDGDEIPDAAVGAELDDDGGTDRGAVYVLFLNADGTVKAEQKISATQGGLTGLLADGDFFSSVSGLGDFNSDGTLDLLVGAQSADGPAGNEGAVFFLGLNTDGTVKTEHKIGAGLAGFVGPIDDLDRFGVSMSSLGDLDGDGTPSVIIGADQDDDGGTARGSVYIIELTAPDDSDGDGLWDHLEDANADSDDDPATTPGPDTDGDTVPNYLDADDDGDGTLTSAENADPNSDGDPRDAKDSDRDGQPDYLDAPLTASRAEIAAEQKISDTAGGLTTTLGDSDRFGRAASPAGDIDGDGTVDLVVGAWSDDDGGTDRGAVYVLFMNQDGTVSAEQKISDTTGGLTAALANDDHFGSAVTSLGDIDGDGVPDLAVGASLDDDGGTNRGATYVLLMNTDGTVKAEQKISDTAGGLTATLDDGDGFGTDVVGLGDVDGDGQPDLLVSARTDDDGGTDRGAVYVLFLNSNGAVKAEQKISNTAGGLTTALDDDDWFGSSVGGPGDVDGDGTPDAVVGAMTDDDGGNARGALYVLLLNADGTVKAEQKISDTSGGLAGSLADTDAFGNSVAGIGDIDSDGVPDIVVGVGAADGTGTGQGLAVVINLTAGGAVDDEFWIGDGLSGFVGPLDDDDGLGAAVAGLGDLDGDGTVNLVIGADRDDDGGTDRGAVYIVNLSNLQVDTDGDGLWDSQEDANTDADDDPATTPGPDTDGDGTVDYLDTDDDGDGVPTAAEEADANADNTAGDARDRDGDGQPDYLDKPLTGTTGRVGTEQRVSDTTGGLTTTLDDQDRFGRAVTGIGDLDRDGVNDMAAGAHQDDDDGTDRGAVYILFMNANGTVKAEQKISDTTGGLTATLDDGDKFGYAVTGIGDLDGDAINDLAVGAPGDDDGGTDRGAIYILFMNATGTVKAEQKISDTTGGLTATPSDGEQFGAAVAKLGDVDADGKNDLLVGTLSGDDGGTDRGGVYVLLMNAAGTVKAEQEISDTAGGLAAALDDGDQFGAAVARAGDVNGDGTLDAIVGAPADDDGGTDRGAIYVLFLNSSGAVTAEQKISDTVGGLTTSLGDGDRFGSAVAGPGDVDDDGIEDLAVGAPADDDGGTDRGAAYVVLLNTAGAATAEQKISGSAGNLTGPLADGDGFGRSLAPVGDLDGDGAGGVAIGADGADDGGDGRGAIYVIEFALPVLLDDASNRRSDLAPAFGVDHSAVSGLVGNAISYGGASERLVAPATDLTSGSVYALGLDQCHQLRNGPSSSGQGGNRRHRYLRAPRR